MKFPTSLVRIVMLTSALAITACGSDDDDGGSANDVVSTFDANSALADAAITTSAASISGTGGIVFTDSVGSVDSGRHFQVAGALDAGDSFTIHTYSDNELANGINLVVARPENTPANLEVTLDGVDISAAFAEVPAEGTVSILMDVHNDEDPTHVLIWPAGETVFGEDTVLENSEDSGNVTSQGTGAFWGITLNGAEITSAQASEDRFED